MKLALSGDSRAIAARATGQGWTAKDSLGLVDVTAPLVPSLAAALEILGDMPFLVASFEKIHPWKGYDAPTFADGHYRHGWACAFRGEGHRRLASRRMLEHGPWRLETSGDLSIVLFHDPAADEATALAQAQPGHRAMGITDEGAYIQTDYVYEYTLNGHYLPESRDMRIVAARRDVSLTEMLDACAARLERRWPYPVDTVSYAFLEEDRARRHLHDLWLRELRCFAMIEGKEHRLDADYAPRPSPPGWTRDL